MNNMKNIRYVFVLVLIVPFSVASCLKEDIIPVPSVNSVKMFMTGIDSKDSLVTEAVKGKTIKFVVETEAEICTIWPGGVRTIMKKKGTAIDSLDMYNHPILTSSDCYIDYGLVGARGFKGTQTDGGWYVSYKYPNAGEFDLTLVVTNHGYNSSDYKQVVVPYGKVIVK
ncbi:MAG: hypothetical protein A2V64_10520 [Bacteroidetes bacterium RBG_13_43_22]|nr:MAG: hypothetical protein A2V64_10520 [Bacteroidetes bacterium RBG_13_43_22]